MINFSVLGCVLLRYEYFCTYIPILQNYILGCHGNHVISHNLFGLMFENNIFLLCGGPNEQFGIIVKIVIGVRGRFCYALGLTSWSFSNDFPVIFQVYMNIHDYANEIIFK